MSTIKNITKQLISRIREAVLGRGDIHKYSLFNKLTLANVYANWHICYCVSRWKIDSSKPLSSKHNKNSITSITNQYTVSFFVGLLLSSTSPTYSKIL